MGYAISLKVANKSAQNIESLWDICSAFEAESSMWALGYPPHITMAMYGDISESALFSAFDSLAYELEQIPITFSKLKTFETDETIVLWAKPDNYELLTELHQKIHSVLNPNLCEQHYRPENWIPHCSLATAIDISRKGEVDNFISSPIEPIMALFDVMDCVSYFPVVVLREQNLQVTQRLS